MLNISVALTFSPYVSLTFLPNVVTEFTEYKCQSVYVFHPMTLGCYWYLSIHSSVSPNSLNPPRRYQPTGPHPRRSPKVRWRSGRRSSNLSSNDTRRSGRVRSVTGSPRVSDGLRGLVTLWCLERASQVPNIFNLSPRSKLVESCSRQNLRVQTR